MYKTTKDIYVQFVILKQEEHISPRSSNHSDSKDRNKLCALGKNNPLMFVMHALGRQLGLPHVKMGF